MVRWFWCPRARTDGSGTYQVSEMVVGVQNHPSWQSAGRHGDQNHHLEAAELQEDEQDEGGLHGPDPSELATSDESR